MDEKSGPGPGEVLEIMMARDAFSRWMGLDVLEIKSGYCRLKYKINEQMLNGFGIVHGGILFSAADSAFAFACNSHGTVAKALDVSISFTKAAGNGEEMMVEARELFLGHKTGLYEITTKNEKGELVALFKGTAYRTSSSFSI